MLDHALLNKNFNPQLDLTSFPVISRFTDYSAADNALNIELDAERGDIGI
jgi:hypothetical protein